MATFRDLTGKRFGKLVVVRQSDKRLGVRQRIAWVCKCDCGRYSTVVTSDLNSGKTKSCGCNMGCHNGAKNIAGMRYGMLTALEPTGKFGKHKNVIWRVRCDCGNISEMTCHQFLQGDTKSCGCLNIKNLIERRLVDVTGMRFGNLVAVRRTDEKSGHCYKWECVCDCGKIKNISVNSLTSGHSKSCGCSIIKRITKHGMSRTKEYNRACANRRREREIYADSEWTVEMEAALKDFFGSCVVCGSKEKLATDHVYPVSLGYGLIPGRAVRLCNRCNCSKGARLPEDLPEPMRSLVLDSAKKFKEYWEWLQGN